MSAYTTLYLSRQKAIEMIIKKTFSMTDDEIVMIMDKILEPRLYNCFISEKGDDDDEI